jgi:hypothetical protein
MKNNHNNLFSCNLKRKKQDIVVAALYAPMRPLHSYVVISTSYMYKYVATSYNHTTIIL